MITDVPPLSYIISSTLLSKKNVFKQGIMIKSLKDCLCSVDSKSNITFNKIQDDLLDSDDIEHKNMMLYTFVKAWLIYNAEDMSKDCICEYRYMFILIDMLMENEILVNNVNKDMIDEFISLHERHNAISVSISDLELKQRQYYCSERSVKINALKDKLSIYYQDLIDSSFNSLKDIFGEYVVCLKKDVYTYLNNYIRNTDGYKLDSKDFYIIDDIMYSPNYEAVIKIYSRVG